MPDNPARRRCLRRIISTFLALALVTGAVVGAGSLAFAALSADSAEQVLGVGRIQSSASVATLTEASAGSLEAPASLAATSQPEASQLVQPLNRIPQDAEQVSTDIGYIKRFGEPDENGWFTTKASAYGPSSAGQYTALGTELTLTSMDIGIQIKNLDLMGRYVDLMYGGKILRCRIVDNGEMAPDGRLFDLQPGVCTYFGAETPEFGWGVRTVKWRFAD